MHPNHEVQDAGAWMVTLAFNKIIRFSGVTQETGDDSCSYIRKLSG